MDPIVAERGRTAAMAAELAPARAARKARHQGSPRRDRAARADQALRRRNRRQRHRRVDRAGRILLAARTFGLGQDHHLDDGRRLCAPRQRYRSARRPRHRRDTAAETQLWHGVSELCDLSPPECLREHRLSATCATLGERRNRRAGDLGARTGAARPLRGPRRAAGSSSASPWRPRSSSTRPSC